MKVNDRVKVTSYDWSASPYGFSIGEIGVVADLEGRDEYPARVRFTSGITEVFAESELEVVGEQD